MWYIKTWIIFFRCLICVLLSFQKGNNKKYYLAGRSLLGQSFRSSEKQRYSFLFFFKMFLKALLLKKAVRNKYVKEYSNGGVYFYDIEQGKQYDKYYQDNEKIRLDQLKYFYGGEINGGIWKSALLGWFNLGDKFIQVLFTIITAIVLLPFLPFVKNKSSLSLIFSEIIEVSNLMKVVESNSVNKLFFYSVYSIDANATALILMKEKVIVVKVVSLTPLQYWNKIIIADELAVSFSTQLNEAAAFKDSILVNKIYLWGPEGLTAFFPRYTKDMYGAAKNKIGFYSTGSYVRQIAGDGKNVFGVGDEDAVLNMLKEYLALRPGLKLTVFLHPREKQEKFKEAVKEYYQKHFQGLDYYICDNPLPSANYFEMVDVGVALYSSSIFERLYCGFKSMLIKPENSTFIPPESLSAITVTDANELTRTLDKYLNISNQEYFKLIGMRSPLLDNPLETTL